MGKLLPKPWGLEDARDVFPESPLFEEEAVKKFDGDKAARERSGLKAAVFFFKEKLDDFLAF